jgi:hypothetical protein
LVKRYYPEVGSPVVDHLFRRVPLDRLAILGVGLAEVVSILARKRNAGRLTPARFRQLVSDVRAEVGLYTPVQHIEVSKDLPDQAIDFIDRYSINSTDAILLRSALDLAAALRAAGDDLLLVTSDRRLLRAAQTEGLTIFDPETQSAAELDAILGP